MDTNEYILKKFNLEFNDRTKMPIEIPNYGRDNLAELFRELGFKIGVEIGVRQGEYSEVILKANPGVKLYSIDPWVKYEGYLDHTLQGTFDRFYKEAEERLSKYPNCQRIRKYSLDAVGDFADESLDFVYIDGNHNFENCTMDISKWLKKIRVGGIIAGDDYTIWRRPTTMHVVEAVNGFTKAYNIRPWFVLGTKAVIEGQIRDKSRSFMWVKTILPRRIRNSQ